MNSDDLDALRSELLRQKIIFEAELRRQREAFDERLASITQELADREADCRNLQSVITILGRKVDAIAEYRPCSSGVHRAPTPTRQSSVPTSPFRRNPSILVPPMSSKDSTQQRSHANALGGQAGVRRASPVLYAQPSSVTVSRVGSISALSRTSSPHVNGHAARPLLRTNTSATSASEVSSDGIKQVPRRRPVSRRRTHSTHRLRDISASDDCSAGEVPRSSIGDAVAILGKHPRKHAARTYRWSTTDASLWE